jgi:2-C-methyl-D-erythritol 4-phosphate cytidylyltransferase
MGFEKVLANLGGRSVLRHSLEILQAARGIGAIVIVGSPAVLEVATGWVGDPAVDKLRAVIAGGAERQESVLRGLGAVPAGTRHVAVHDAARPLVALAAVEATVAMGREHGAAVLARPIPDTVKRVDADGRIVASVERDGLWAMETPQVARLDWLIAALAAVKAAGGAVTDEVSALQAAGHAVHVVRDVMPNPKITWPEDLELAMRWQSGAAKEYPRA